MSRHDHSGIGDSKILQRKIPSRGRYNDVPSRIDTGSSITRHLKKIEEIQTNYRYKKDELFKRMKATTLAQLILQVANVSMQDESSISDLASARSEASSVTLNGNFEEVPQNRLSSPDNLKNGFHDDLSSPRSSLQSVIRGVGEIDMGDRNKPNMAHSETSYIEKPYHDCPYLLLDVRDCDEFSICHITGATNFPIAMLSRTMNNFTKEILDYKNCPGRIIILYDEDERISTVAATTMVERGFDNIFVLSGGLKVMYQKIPDGITNGAFPVSCRAQSRHKVSHYVGPPFNSRKKRFSAEDLDKISHYLEDSLIPQDTGSRLSRLTNNSERSRNDSNKSVSTFIGNASHKRAWR